MGKPNPRMFLLLLWVAGGLQVVEREKFPLVEEERLKTNHLLGCIEVLAMVVFWELKHVLGMLSVVTYWVIFKNEI